MTENEPAAIIATVQVAIAVGVFFDVPPFPWLAKWFYVIVTWPIDAVERLVLALFACCAAGCRGIVCRIRKRKSTSDELP